VVSDSQLVMLAAITGRSHSLSLSPTLSPTFVLCRRQKMFPRDLTVRLWTAHQAL